MVFLFFKQEAAYEMRIGDWSSDVCSADLNPAQCRRRCPTGRRPCAIRPCATRHRVRRPRPVEGKGASFPCRQNPHRSRDRDKVKNRRSEEHTSELQSLMRISYAVFCLKKKKTEHQNLCINTQNESTQTNKY